MAPRKATTETETPATENVAGVPDELSAKPKWKSAAANTAGGGFTSAKRTRRIVADPDVYTDMKPDFGSDPFTAEIVDGLTFNDLEDIPTAGPLATWDNQKRAIAPYVIAWNAVAINCDTNEIQQAPPPAEYGWEILETQTKALTSFLVAAIKFGAGTSLPKGGTNGNHTDSGDDDTN